MDAFELRSMVLTTKPDDTSRVLDILLAMVDELYRLDRELKAAKRARQDAGTGAA